MERARRFERPLPHPTLLEACRNRNLCGECPETGGRGYLGKEYTGSGERITEVYPPAYSAMPLRLNNGDSIEAPGIWGDGLAIVAGKGPCFQGLELLQLILKIQ